MTPYIVDQEWNNMRSLLLQIFMDMLGDSSAQAAQLSQVTTINP
jgi:hypothetical protein